MQLSKTELDFLRVLLLDAQRRLGEGERTGDQALVEALELALAVLRWDGAALPELDAQVGLGAAIEQKLGPDAMCAYRQWRNARRRLRALH